MIFYTSDLHLSSYRNLSYRPFQNIEEMDNTLIANINSRVKQNDTLYIVGDVCKCHHAPIDLIRKIHGRKILIAGNNDIPILLHNRKFRECFEKVYMGNFIMYDKYIGSSIFLNHYPCCSWEGSRNNIPHFYGHLHSLKEDGYDQISQIPLAFNVGVDVTHYYPVTAEERITGNLYNPSNSTT